jgi:hypothetical protein
MDPGVTQESRGLGIEGVMAIVGTITMGKTLLTHRCIGHFPSEWS